MPDSDDNVIPFPGGRGNRRNLADRLADDLLARGHDPGAPVSQLLDAGSRFGQELPQRRLPATREPPAEVARFRVRVDLDEVRPPVWRRLELAGDLTLADLHEILQTAMGWTDTHLHHFLAGPRRDHGVLPFLTDFDEEEGDEGIHERDVRLDQVLAEPGDRLFYEYDFGDGWEHTLRLEEVTAYDASEARARVTGGRRACPPEDCGGVGGYDAVVAALADPDAATGHSRDLLDWLPEGYDPAAFSVDETDELMRLTLSTLGGVRSVEATLEVHGTGFAPVLTELFARSNREPKHLTSLVTAAGLQELDEPDEVTREGVVWPWLHLLDLVGDRARLTSAGWLAPAMVTRLATDLGLLEPWMGKGNREEFTVPVLKIRGSAVAMGLLRTVKGDLVVTRAGRAVAGDADAMWRHLVAALPLGRKDYELHAGAVMLLAVAAGHPPYDGIRLHGPSLLWHAGWSAGARPLDDGSVIDLARPTWEALSVTGCTTGRSSTHESVTTAGRQLARAALRQRS